jgi:hypothetical protein
VDECRLDRLGPFRLHTGCDPNLPVADLLESQLFKRTATLAIRLLDQRLTTLRQTIKRNEECEGALLC